MQSLVKQFRAGLILAGGLLLLLNPLPDGFLLTLPVSGRRAGRAAGFFLTMPDIALIGDHISGGRST